MHILTRSCPDGCYTESLLSKMAILLAAFCVCWLSPIGGNYALAELAIQPSSKVFKTNTTNVQVDVIADGFDHPWAMTELPGNRMIVTERSGKMWLLDLNTQSKQEIAGLPPITSNGQGGLLDVAIDPEFASNKILYFTFSDPQSPGSTVTGTAIASAKLNAEPKPVLKNLKTLYSQKHKTDSGHHFGSRIAISPDGTLFFTIGDRGESTRAQDLSDSAGSVMRINKDGSIPADNPFIAITGADNAIWSYGHRNPQGAAINPANGKLYTVEHGARGGDEINLPQKGKNYGWPVISYGRHYSGEKIGVGTEEEGMEQPLFYWDPSIAPSGMAFYNGKLFKKWNGNILIGALKDQMLVRLKLEGDKITEQERMLVGEYGRIRDVAAFDDGSVWLLTDDENGKLLKLVPSE